MRCRLLTGEFPFTAPELAAPRIGSPSPTAKLPSSFEPELGKEMDAFFARALAPDPAQRFPSARELATAFSALVTTGRPSRAANIPVVDDEPNVALVMQLRFRTQIQILVYEFIFASNGEKALARPRQHPDTDVLLRDQDQTQRC